MKTGTPVCIFLLQFFLESEKIFMCIGVIQFCNLSWIYFAAYLGLESAVEDLCIYLI